jgi:serine/threonine-protein kinase RsbW
MVRSLTVPGRYDQLEAVCQFVTTAAELAELGEKDIAHCQLAVDEACTNVIEHGYGGENIGSIEVRCEVVPGTLTITIHDSARPFDPAHAPAPNVTPTNLDDLRIGGLGLHFMRQVMDEVQFSYENGGNTLKLVKLKK